MFVLCNVLQILPIYLPLSYVHYSPLSWFPSLCDFPVNLPQSATVTSDFFPDATVGSSLLLVLFFMYWTLRCLQRTTVEMKLEYNSGLCSISFIYLKDTSLLYSIFRFHCKGVTFHKFIQSAQKVFVCVLIPWCCRSVLCSAFVTLAKFNS